MYNNKRIIALIPARGGSVGVKRKNIKSFCGFPLIHWTIEATKNSKYIDQIFVSTEDIEIGAISMLEGVGVLFRPTSLAQSDSHIKDVMKYHINEMGWGDNDLIILLNPTSPIRILNGKNIIDEVIEKFDCDKYDQCATGYMCRNYEYGKAASSNRQVLVPWKYDDCAVYIHKCFYLANGEYWCPDESRRLFIELSEEFNKEIDTEIDFVMVEALFKYLNKL